jgi:hypothetical protein
MFVMDTQYVFFLLGTEFFNILFRRILEFNAEIVPVTTACF